MKVNDFIAKLKNADTARTRYVTGGIGQPLTKANRDRLIAQYPKNASRDLPVDSNCWAFDCIGVIKAILWGWSNTKYGSNGVPDTDETTFFNKYCTEQTTDFTQARDGWAVWTKGHIGVIIDADKHLAVECTPKWDNGVQITAVGNLGAVKGYNTRTWTKCAKISFVDYGTNKTETAAKKTNEEIAAEVLAGKWGNGNARKSALIKAGYDYATIQSLVNASAKKTTTTKKTNEEIVAEVIAGKWGNGAVRKSKLTKAGYDYATIQKLVDAKLKGNTETVKTVTANALNIRAGASTNNAVIGVVTKGTKLTLVSTKNGWGELKDNKGWVSLDWVK